MGCDVAYLALYREWRPQTFADVVGQPHIVRTLQNALRQRRLAHAYLFTGPRGTGKTSTAKILAKAVNCERGPAEEPCNQCRSCLGISDGSVMDVVEIDAASNRGIDEIRNLREQVRYVPTQVRYKVYIIDEVHMLTPEAFNALLKTLEEPPEHVIFILATTEPHKLPATIVSRCQRFAFQRIFAGDAADRMKRILEQKGRRAEEKALWLIARAAEGGLRDALSLLDQALAFCEDELREEDVLALLGRLPGTELVRGIEAWACGDVRAALLWLRDQLERGVDAGPLAAALLDYLRDLLWARTAPDHPEIQARLRYEPELKAAAERLDTDRILSWMEILTEMEQQIRWYGHPQLLMELTVARLCRMGEGARLPSDRGAEALVPPPEWAARLDRLEEQVRLLMESEQAPAPASPSGGDRGRPAEGRTAGEERPAPSVAAPRGTAVRPSADVPAPEGEVRWEELRGSLDVSAAAPVRERWPEVLDEVKRRRVTTQAWLLDGEPVARAGTRLVLAFKNHIHRETVMKPMHRTVIEEVLRSLFGEPIQLYAVPHSLWQQEQARTEEAAAAEATAGRGTEPSASQGGGAADPDPLEQLIELFGEDKVEILEEE